MVLQISKNVRHLFFLSFKVYRKFIIQNMSLLWTLVLEKKINNFSLAAKTPLFLRKALFVNRIFVFVDSTTANGFKRWFYIFLIHIQVEIRHIFGMGSGNPINMHLRIEPPHNMNFLIHQTKSESKKCKGWKKSFSCWQLKYFTLKDN